MTALTTDRATARRSGQFVSDTLATGALIFAGGMYGLVQGTGEAAAIGAAGVTIERVRAVARSRASQVDGDAAVEGERGVFCFANDDAAPYTAADIDTDAFALDDQTLSKSGTIAAGRVVSVDEAGVWVEIGHLAY